MNGAQLALIAHAIALIGAMVALVPALTSALGAQSGFMASLVLYWLGFCLPVIAIHVWPRRSERLFSERLAWRHWFVPMVLLVQVGLVALVAFVPNTALLTTHGAMLAALIAIVNAPLEETAWRGGFMTVFADRPRTGFWLGWLLFTAWHAPLLLAHGMVFDGGWIALVGGASVLGLLWSAIAWRTGSVFWVILAHGLTNVLTFWVLFEQNGFA